MSPKPPKVTIEISGRPLGLHFTGDGATLIVGSQDVESFGTSTLTLVGYDVETCSERFSHRLTGRLFEGFEVGPDDNYICVYGQGGVSVLAMESGAIVFETSDFACDKCIFLDNDQILISRGWVCTWVLNIAGGKLQRGEDICGMTASISVHPDRKTIVFSSVAQEGSVAWFSFFSDGQFLVADTSPINSACPGLQCAFSPDGGLVVCVDSLVHVYAFPSKERLAILDQDGEVVEDLSLLPDEIINGGGDTSWSNMIFSPDSRYLFCESPAGKIVQWDLEFCQLYATFEGSSSRRGRYLALSPNGNTLVNIGDDMVVNFTKVDLDLL